jgi:hypothetical protein
VKNNEAFKDDILGFKVKKCFHPEYFLKENEVMRDYQSSIAGLMIFSLQNI